jgi:hypothetical protein
MQSSLDLHTFAFLKALKLSDHQWISKTLELKNSVNVPSGCTQQQLQESQAMILASGKTTLGARPLRIHKLKAEPYGGTNPSDQPST